MSCLWNSGSRLTLLAVSPWVAAPANRLSPTAGRPARHLPWRHHADAGARTGAGEPLAPPHLSANVRGRRLRAGRRRRRCTCRSRRRNGHGRKRRSLPEASLLLANRSERFTIAAGKTLNVVCLASGGGPPPASGIACSCIPSTGIRNMGPPGIVLEQVRSEEDLETSADIDEYALVGQQGKDVVAYLSNAGPGGAGSFSLGFYAEDSEQIARRCGCPGRGRAARGECIGAVHGPCRPACGPRAGHRQSSPPTRSSFARHGDRAGGFAW